MEGSDRDPAAAPTATGAPELIKSHAAPVLRTGDVVADRYELQQRLGAGGMGSVWRARDRELGEDVALKAVHPDLVGDATARERFRREVKLARKIAHRNVCRVFDVGEDDRALFLTMELVDGDNLRALLERGELSVDDRMRVVREVAAGLAAAHERGVIHRDLKPANVLVASDGHALVADFGLARAPIGDQSTTSVAGTPGYMSPEQLRGEAIDARSDVFSCALVAFEVLGGGAAFGTGTAATVASAILRDRPAALTGTMLDGPVEAAVGAVLSRALSKMPSHRHADAAELGAALDEAFAGTSRAPTRRRWGTPALIGVAAIAACAVIAASLAARSSGTATRTVRTADAAPPGQPSDARPTVRVAAFDNLTGDPSSAPLGASAAEAVRASLRTLADVRVLGDGDESVTPVWVVTGSVQELGDGIRIAAQFRDAHGAIGQPIDVDGARDATAALVDDLRARSMDEMRIVVREYRRRRAAETGTDDAGARDKLLAYYDLIGPSPGREDLIVGRELLDAALAADPRYVPALVERALVHLMGASSTRDRAELDAGLADLDAAAAVAPSFAPQQILRCRAAQFAAEFDGSPTDVSLAAAEAACTEALENDPQSARARLVLARIYERQCRDDLALDSLERALVADPSLSGEILTQIVSLAVQSGRLVVADKRSAQLVAFQTEETRLGARAPSRRSGARPTLGAHLIRAGVLLRTERLSAARGELEAELAAVSAGLGDQWAEAAAIRGLLRIAPEAVAADLRRRLTAIEREYSAVVADQPGAAFRLAAGYYWTDVDAAIQWLDRMETPTSCVEAIARAELYRVAGDPERADRALDACVSEQQWAARCLSQLRENAN